MKLPLLVLACGVVAVTAMTSDLWRPLIGGAFTSGEARGNATALAGSQSELPEDFEDGAFNTSPSVPVALDPELVRLEREAAERLRLEQQAREQARTRNAEGARTGKAAPGEAQPQPGSSGDTPEAAAPAIEPIAVPIETVEGQLVNPNVTGQLQEATARRIRGWVQDKFEPETALYVDILINDQLAYSVRAEKREDNKNQGVIWRFEIGQPAELQDAEKHIIRAFVYRHDQHGKTELRNSPRTRGIGSYPRGRLEEASPETGISGYAWDPDTNKKACDVIVRIDGETIATIKANVKNEELLRRKITPRDNCAFRLEWPEILNDGLAHTVQVFAVDTDEGTEHELEGSPRVVNPAGGNANEPPVGAFDICNKVVLAGWAWDPDVGTGNIDVEIWIDGALHTTVTANSKREQLHNSKVTPDPFHGWVLSTPEILKDGATHTIRAYALNYPGGVKVELQGSPKQYRLEENSEPMGSFWRADDNTLRGWAADPDLGTAPCEIEIYIDGKLWLRTHANRKEEWLVGSGYAPNAEHGFAIKPPDFVKDGEEHEVQIFAINYPDGPPKNLGTRTIGVNSVFPGFWTGDKLLDTRNDKGLQVTSVSPWYNAYHVGVKAGDVLLEYAGIEAGKAEVKDAQGNVTEPGTMTKDFRIWLNTQKKKNDVVRFKFWRDGETYEVDIKLGEIIGR